MLWTLNHDGNQPMEHQAGEGHKMQPRKRLRQALVVPDQAPEARRPGKPMRDDPPAGQQDEAALGRGHLVDLQPDAMAGGIRRWSRSRVALVNKCHPNLLPRCRLPRR